MTDRPCVICTVREAREDSQCCQLCINHTDANLAEIPDRWAMLPTALEPGRGEEQRISGSREPPLPGGEALNLLAPGNLYPHPRGHMVPLYRSGDILGDRKVKRDPCLDVTDDCPALLREPTEPGQPERYRRCGEQHTCGEQLGHTWQHRIDRASVHRWPYRRHRLHESRLEDRREPVLDERGRQRQVPNGDQHGNIDPTEVLWSWVRDWLTYRHAGEHGPQADLTSIVGWLRARLGWAADHHPAVDDFATEVRQALNHLRNVVGDTPSRPDQCEGVPCRRCDNLSLWRRTDGSGDVECSTETCRLIYRPAEYERWVRLVAAGVRDGDVIPRRDTAEVMAS